MYGVQPEGPYVPEERRRFVVCGDNPLALRVVNELVMQYAADVTVIMPSIYEGQGPQIAEMAGVTVVEACRPAATTWDKARPTSLTGHAAPPWAAATGLLIPTIDTPGMSPSPGHLPGVSMAEIMVMPRSVPRTSTAGRSASLPTHGPGPG